MKKFTLLTLAFFMSIVMFAQKGDLFRPMKMMTAQQQTLRVQGIDRKAQPIQQVTRRAEGDQLVVVPEGTAETFYTTKGKFYNYGDNGWEDATADMESVQVLIDGTDMYIQGLAYWFKDAWIKGSIDGNVVTFANGQFVGEDEYGSEYLAGSDDGTSVAESIVFTYNAEEGLLEATTPYIFESSSPTKVSAYTYWSKPTFSKTAPAAPEVVTVPEGLVAEEYALSYVDYYKEAAYGSVMIGFDGTDVYMQGISTYLPEAWIKGTLDGTTITFAGNQFLGKYYSYDIYLQEKDVVFTYDAETAQLTAESLYAYTGSEYTDYYTTLVIKKIVEKAGVPATPTISGISETQYGDILAFSVPTVDVDGNGMVTSKLSYQFFTDINREVSPLTFTTADYTKLTEDMTVIPYGFSDNYDIYSDRIYLNMDYDNWNKIGIQSIYTGGGEEHKSEIFWYTIQEYSQIIINFNAMTNEPTSSSDTHDGDITENRQFTEGNVTLTVSPSTTTTPNRLWSTANGPQLRVYSGTLTFDVPSDKVITQMVFNAGKWNEGNTSDSGAFEGTTWTGNAQQVVVTIAANTQLNSIEVTTDDFVPVPVEAPEGLVTETYNFKAKAQEYGEEDFEDYELQVEVGFDGNDAYIQGLAGDAPELWVKATKNEEGKYVIPANQYMGSLNLMNYFIFDYFFTAIDEQENMVDAVFSFDETTNTFSTDQMLALNGDLSEIYPYMTFTEVTISKIAEVAATPADPSVLAFTPTGNYPKVKLSIPLVGTNGETLLSSKLFYQIWIEKDGQEQPLTLTATLYTYLEADMTEIPYTYDDNWDVYAGGETVYLNQGVDELATWTKIGVQSIYRGAGEEHKSNIGWMENYSGINNLNADLKAGKAVIFNLSGQRLQTPQKGLNIINGKKVVIK